MKFNKTILFFLLIAVLTFPAYRSLLRPGFFTTMDGHLHLYRAIELGRAMKDGQFPVRWGANFANGYGLPIYNFYSPLFYYLSAAIAGLSGSFLSAVKTILVTNFIMAGIFMFLLAKELWGRWGGMAAGILYVYTPYFFVNVYVRGAFPEALTFSLLPLVFWSWTKYFKAGSGFYLFLGSLAFGLLPLAHNFLALASLPFILAFIFFKSRQGKTLGPLIGLGLGLATSCFFWLPVMLEQKYLLPEIFLNNYDYRDSFLYLNQLIYSPWGYEGNVKGPGDGMSFMIGFPLILLILGALLTGFILEKKAKQQQRLFLTGFIAAAVMTLPVSALVWQLIPPFQVAQFPWRFLVLAVFFGSLAAGSCVLIFQKKSRAAVAILIACLAILLNQPFARPKDHNGAYSDKTYSGHHLGIPRAPVIGDDFTPTWIKQRPEKPAEKLVEPAEFYDGLFLSHRYAFTVDLDQQRTYSFNTYYYPGWAGYIDGQKTDIRITDSGLFELMIPPGKHRVEAVFEETPLRQKADCLSLTGLGGLLVLSLTAPVWKKVEKRVMENRQISK